MRMHKVVLASLCGLLAWAAPADAQSRKTTPQIKVVTSKTVSTPVKEPSAFGETFEERSLVRARCSRGQLPLALGIASATHPLASQDLGTAGMSVYASGPAGTARTRLQALCVRGGRAPTYTGRSVRLGATGQGTAVKATVSCRTGQVALGAALAHGHAPAFGSYMSAPDGTRRWEYVAQIPESVVAQLGGNVSSLGYPRVACVRATGVSTVEFRGVVTPSMPAEGTVTCRRGRVLGWGVQLPRHATRPAGDGSWAIPTIERARFDGARAMSFRFNGASGDPSDAQVRAVVICGTLPKG
jgi:hypothetical protein